MKRMLFKMKSKEKGQTLINHLTKNTHFSNNNIRFDCVWYISTSGDLNLKKQQTVDQNYIQK